MKKLSLVFLLLLFIPGFIFAQKRKKKIPTSLSISTSLNYYGAYEPYTFSNSFEYDEEDLILTFLTANSGTFVIENPESYNVERKNENRFPVQSFGLGFSLQVLKGKKEFHEISLSRFSYTKSEHSIDYIFSQGEGQSIIRPFRGYRQRALAFAFRYEYGHYFGEGNFRFGLSGSLEPSFYFYKRQPTISSECPITATIIGVEIALIPILSFNLSKKVTMDFKVIPNLLMGTFERVREKNPALTIDQQSINRDISLPEINMAFSWLVRYQIKAPDKRRRR